MSAECPIFFFICTVSWVFSRLSFDHLLFLHHLLSPYLHLLHSLYLPQLILILEFKVSSAKSNSRFKPVWTQFSGLQRVQNLELNLLTNLWIWTRLNQNSRASSEVQSSNQGSELNFNSARTSSKYFSPSILIVDKFHLEVLFVSLKGVFLLEESKLGLNLDVRNCLHKIGSV